jgi:methylthioribose-1-phosphate isomerase
MSVEHNSVVLLQGVFAPAVFDLLKKRKAREVFVMEGRPGLEAAVSSCAELLRRGLKPTLIADNMAGFLFYQGLLKEVWLSSYAMDQERVLCHVGALALGVLGQKHSVPVYTYLDNRKLRLLGRSREITHFKDVKIAARGVKGYVPLAEWVPKKFITEIYER